MNLENKQNMNLENKQNMNLENKQNMNLEKELWLFIKSSIQVIVLSIVLLLSCLFFFSLLDIFNLKLPNWQENLIVLSVIFIPLLLSNYLIWKFILFYQKEKKQDDKTIS